jgi:hypothetical protein
MAESLNSQGSKPRLKKRFDLPAPSCPLGIECLSDADLTLFQVLRDKLINQLTDAKLVEHASYQTEML